MSENNAVIQYYNRAVSVMNHLDSETAVQIVDQIAASLSCGGKVLICGNGGSAADASHFAGELVGRFRREREPIPAIALTTDPSVLTALGNDYGYKLVFSRQVAALGSSDDVLIAISTSGTSPNILEAAEEAVRIGMKVIAFTSSACKTAQWADIHWKASCPETSHAQEQMLIAFHAICHGLEDVLAEQS